MGRDTVVTGKVLDLVLPASADLPAPELSVQFSTVPSELLGRCSNRHLPRLDFEATPAPVFATRSTLDAHHLDKCRIGVG